MHILVIGNPVDGFKFEGLFTNEADATTYGEIKYPNTEWWITSINILPLITKENASKYNNFIAKIADALNELLIAVNTNNIKNARVCAVALAADATDLYNELCEGDSTPTGYSGHAGAGEDAPLPTPKVRGFSSENKCACGHDWSQHTQNVHGLWICGQCNCRGMQPPSEIPNRLGDDF